MRNVSLLRLSKNNIHLEIFGLLSLIILLDVFKVSVFEYLFHVILAKMFVSFNLSEVNT